MKPFCLFPLLLLVSLLVAAVICTGCTGLMEGKGPLARLPESPAPVPAGTQTPDAIFWDDSLISPTPDTGPVLETTTAAARDPVGYQPLRPLPAPGEPVEYRTFSFTFRSDEYSVRIPVNMSLYNGAAGSQNKGLAIDKENAGSFYRQMMNDPAMDAFYRDMIREVGRLKYKGGKTLTDDEYLEFLVSFVQQIPYENTTRFPRYPVEVIYHQSGDCDEKAVLLTGILAREGYDAALLIFPEMSHATAGIRIHLVTGNPSFRVFSDGKRDYVYIETTTSRLIGIYPEEYATAAEPVIVPAGNGTLLYNKFTSVTSILYDLNSIRTKIRSLEEKAAAAGGKLKPDDYDLLLSYIDTYNVVMSTNDRIAAREAIQESELPHYSACMSCN